MVTRKNIFSAAFLAALFSLAAISATAHADQTKDTAKPQDKDDNKVTVDAGEGFVGGTGGVGAAGTLRIGDTQDNDELKLTVGGIADHTTGVHLMGSLSGKVFSMGPRPADPADRNSKFRGFYGDNHWILSDGQHNTFAVPALTMVSMLWAHATEFEVPAFASGAHIGSRTNFVEVTLPRGVYSVDRATGRSYIGAGAEVLTEQQLSALWTIFGHAAYTYAESTNNGPGVNATLVSASMGARFKANKKLVIEGSAQLQDTIEAKQVGSTATVNGQDPQVIFGLSFQSPVR